MKLTIVLFIATIMQVSASSFAQQVTLSKKNITFSELFDEVYKQTGYTVFWKSDQLKGSTTLDANFSRTPLSEVISKSLQGKGLAFVIEDNTILIKAAAEKGFVEKVIGFLKSIDVRGRVVDENGNGLAGATIRVKGTNRSVLSGNTGEFFLAGVDEKAVLVISYVGYQPREIKTTDDVAMTITLISSTARLDSVAIISTGFQQIPKERATGSFVQIDNSTLNRRVSTNILDRIEGISPGLFSTGVGQINPITVNPNNRNFGSGLTIRGQSTFNSSTDPLIVLDNFPYEGEIRNINPNDVESITILKDAAAASIWGARSGNGVIVITSKKGKLNQKPKIDFNSSVTVAGKPNLFFQRNHLDTRSYIEIEQLLFNQGFFNAQLNNTTSFPTVSPAVELMAQYKLATTDDSRSNLQSQIDNLKTLDVRNDYNYYIYQHLVNQQYSLGVRGGTNNSTYTLSVGSDKNKDVLIRNGYQRSTFNTLHSYHPIKGLEIGAGINYSQNTTSLNNNFGVGQYNEIGSPYNQIYPYARLADENGVALPIARGLRNSYVQLSQNKGYLDWTYRPLDDIKLANNTTKITDLIIKFSGNYQLISELNAEISYQNERQIIHSNNLNSRDSYYSRNLFNTYSTYDSSTGRITNNLPKGGILIMNDYDWHGNNLRGQLNYNQSFNRGRVKAIGGAEIRELKSEGTASLLYGFNDQFGSATTNVNYNTIYATSPSGSAFIPNSGIGILGTLNRYISYFTNVSYDHAGKYLFSVSGRKDGANLFGAKTNDKITPLWSSGFSWTISKETFYNVDLLTDLRIRTSYGYNGNTYQNGNSFLSGTYITASGTSAKAIASLVAPNPKLRWERVKNINFGIDFTGKNNRISGSIEIYMKNGLDLIQPTDLAAQTGFASYQANTAKTSTKGADIIIQSQNFQGKFKWNTIFLLNTLNDKVQKFDAARSSSSISSYGGVVGKPLYALYAYKWAGLNPLNGNPRGELNGQLSENYTAIRNNFNPDSLVYKGSARPTIFGSFRNEFSYKNFSLSVNMIYQLNFFFRRSSTSLNYTDLIQKPYTEYNLRWQKPGDELLTNIPSIVYPSNSNRNNFFQFSEILVEKGDNVRIQDVRLGYSFARQHLKASKISNINIYSYANNIGIIWRKNKNGIDPNAIGNGIIKYPNPMSISFGLSANF